MKRLIFMLFVFSLWTFSQSQQVDPSDKNNDKNTNSSPDKSKDKKVTKKAKEQKPSKKITQIKKGVDKKVGAISQANENAAVAGCPKGSVWVNPSAQNISRFREMVSLRIYNVGRNNIDIESTRPKDKGPIVRNLCPGGSVNVYFSYGMYLDPYQQEQFDIFVVGGESNDTFTIWMNNYGRRYSHLWRVR